MTDRIEASHLSSSIGIRSIEFEMRKTLITKINQVNGTPVQSRELSRVNSHIAEAGLIGSCSQSCSAVH